MRTTIRIFSLVLAGSLMISSCGPVENSSALDESRFGPIVEIPGSPLFSAVRTSLNKCSNCHGSWLSMTEEQFISTGLVVAGSPDSSKLYYRNQGAASGPGPHDMPINGFPALSSAELQDMIDWINAL